MSRLFLGPTNDRSQGRRTWYRGYNAGNVVYYFVFSIYGVGGMRRVNYRARSMARLLCGSTGVSRVWEVELSVTRVGVSWVKWKGNPCRQPRPLFRAIANCNCSSWGAS